ncbi:DNA repair protein RadC [Marinobacterium zhoushanense]|uniref:DNA repair protein RadC n=1 Tax=Marinobacterium zhoushanense TaxID=1679163 RepID=A0ABQ1JY98_9GAMM|nr:DNA repair protein RadC [Marinobacterium zhoushanense]GGB82179.1 DNA repair protein RadC [Marinobacterium zhoushanense]
MAIARLIAGEEPGTYVVPDAVTEAELLHLAKMIARRRLAKGRPMSKPEEVRRALQTLLIDYEHEVFGILMLDNQHKIIKFIELFRGTIDSASVYPREVVKESLALNAAAVVLVHNHPSGILEPSHADKQITQRLCHALSTVDIRVLDHVIVGAEGYSSLAELGLL